MGEETTVTSEQTPPVVEQRQDIPDSLSVSQAAKLLGSLAHKKSDLLEQAPTPAVEPAMQSEAKAEDAQPIEAQGEEQEAEADVPPIKPPVSWSREEKERFQSLPRETQEYLAEREGEREKSLTRSQQDAAEQRKALDAERQRVEQSRQQYETALPQLYQTLHSQQAGEFSDVKTIADVERLAKEDWPRYLQWDVSQKKLAAVQQEMLGAQQRQHQEKQQQFGEFAKRQDDLFVEKVPEMSDPAKAEKLQKGAIQVLTDLGFARSELEESWTGQKDISLRDHRIQLLIRDALAYREERTARTKAASALADKKVPAPKVQRPGSAQTADAARVAQFNQLAEKLPTLRGNAAIDAAVQLLHSRRGR